MFEKAHKGLDSHTPGIARPGTVVPFGFEML